MSEQETTGPSGNVYVSEWPDTSLSKLTELAQQAYEQKRTKDCLDFTRAILLMDPENAEAQLMRSSIRSEMRQDLENVSALLRQARGRQENPEMYPPSGDEMAHKDIEGPPEAEQTQTIPPHDGCAAAADAPLEEPLMAAAVSERIFDIPARPPKRRWLKRACAVVFVGLVIAGLPKFISKSNLVGVSPSLRASNGTPQAPVLNKSGLPEAAPIIERQAMQPTDWWLPEPTPAVTPAAAPPVTESNPGGVQLASLKTAQAPQPTASRDKPIVPAAAGTLAISSPTSVEIYMDDTYLGSAPVSLEMPAGMHTIEYRHGSLRKRVTHLVNSNETTRAMISFDITIQVNSKPWAEVFVDGVDRKPLGQTPLSGVRVPIGGVLVFENPGFRAKRYRVTGNETGIQIVFP